jgi:apolipoprotein N-acyltransferase
MEIRGKRLGFLVCYEQFLTWPFLSLMSQEPDVIVAPSNLWWCRDTSLPGIQAASVRLWARLFGSSLISAANL